MTSRSRFALLVSFAVAVASVGACSAQIHDNGAGGSGGSGAGGASASCPAAPPANADPCKDDSLSCRYGSEDCPRVATCEYGAWSIPPVDVCCGNECPMSACPPAPPTEGASCAGPSSGCVYMVDDACGNQVTEEFECDGTWQKLEPGGPSECSTTQQCALRGVDNCAEDGKCKWLEPGCASQTPPFPLSSAGCYPTTDCLQSPALCGSGELCESVVINPCFDSNCDTCGMTWGICLVED